MSSGEHFKKKAKEKMGLKYQVTYTKGEVSHPPIDVRWFHAFFSDREFLSQAYGPDV